MLEFNQGKRDPMYISEKHDSNDIPYDIENLEHLEENKDRNLKPYLIKSSASEYNYKINKMQNDLEKVNLQRTWKMLWNMRNYIYISWLWLSHESWLREQQTCHKISWNLYSMRFPQLNCQMRTNTHFINTSLGRRRIEFHRSRTYLLTPALSLAQGPYDTNTQATLDAGPCDPVPWCSENWTVFWR